MNFSKRDVKIYELEMKIEYMKKEFKVVEREVVVKNQEARMDQTKSIERLTCMNNDLTARLEESPSKLLQDILKALTVKIPTLDIKTLSVGKK